MANQVFDWDSRLASDPHGLHSTWGGGIRRFIVPSFEDHEPSDCLGPEHLIGEPAEGAGLEYLAVMISARLEQALQFRQLEGHVTDLIERVALLEGLATNNAGTTARIQTFAPEPYNLLQPIGVSIVTSSHGEFVASFYDANIAASGDNEQEAFDNLKSLILDMFDSLSAEHESRLGPEPKRQLAVLREFLAHA